MWIKTSQRLPVFDVPVLVNCRIYGRFIATYERISPDYTFGQWTNNTGRGILPPTHWMPLPDLPSDDASRAPVERGVMRDGYDRLWLWFGLSRASWLTMPRIMMHEMPDEWQNKMAELLEEWDDAWDSSDMPDPFVSAKKGNKFTKWPEWLLCYRHPDLSRINALRKVPHNAELTRRSTAIENTLAANGRVE